MIIKEKDIQQGYDRMNDRMCSRPPDILHLIDGIPSLPLPDANEALQQSRRLNALLESKDSSSTGSYKWTIPSLQEWSSCARSSLLVINGGFVNRFVMKGLCVDLVDIFREKGMAVVWVLRPGLTDKIDIHATVADVIKYLILQLIQLPQFHSNQTLATSVSAIFQRPVHENECFNCLKSVLSNLSEAFIIMDFMAVPALSSDFWSMQFLNIFESLDDTHNESNVKVALISYGRSETIQETIEAQWKDRLIVIKPPSLPHLFLDSQKRHSPSSLAKMREVERSRLAESIKRSEYPTRQESVTLLPSVNGQNPREHRPLTVTVQEEYNRERQIYSNPESTLNQSPQAPVQSPWGTRYTVEDSFPRAFRTDVGFQFDLHDNQQLYPSGLSPVSMNKISTRNRSSSPYHCEESPQPASSMGFVDDMAKFTQSSRRCSPSPQGYQMYSTFDRPQCRSDFKIALICALRVEFDAVEALFDEFYEDDFSYGKSPGDPNAYTTGRIIDHNVVLAYMPGMGKANSASLAASFRASFSEIKVGIVVGVCGGVPTGTDDEREVLLGDAIISTGLVQFDFGKQYPDKVVRKNTLEGNLGRPNREIRALLAKLSGARSRKILREKTSSYLANLCEIDGLHQYKYPGAENDRLYRPEYRHKHQDPTVCRICAACHNMNDEVCSAALESSCEELRCQYTELVSRVRVNSIDLENAPKPLVHFGLIASGDLVMKSGYHRDRIVSREKVIAFEMEGAGVWDVFPTVVIKSVCDYADSHKSKKWQTYAAATAACCMKAFLSEWRHSN